MDKNGNKVVHKVTKNNLFAIPADVLREIALLKMLFGHPNIISIIDVITREIDTTIILEALKHDLTYSLKKLPRILLMP